MPVTPDNLLPPNEAKRRTARIEPDYLRHTSTIDAWKGRLALIATVAAIGWFVIAALGDLEQQLATRGPVANAHAIWENNCQACHVDFTPISGSAGGLALTDWAHASDQNCQKCHAGPPHHEQYALFDAGDDRTSANCATCHTDHQGRDADLARVADRHCTVCHADLPDHSRRSTGLAGGTRSEERFAARIDSFSLDAHPKFRSLASDPGKLEFNHALHMKAGLAAKDAREPYRLQSMPEEFRVQYSKYAVKDGLIQLECSSCHELDRAVPGDQPDGLPDAINMAFGGGEYYRPVVYERHCQACHDLKFSTDASLGDVQLPHRLSAQQLETRVRERLLAPLVRNSPKLQERLEPIPGPKPLQVLPDTSAKWIEEQVEQAAKHLNTKAVCIKCHPTAQSVTDAAPSSFPDVAAVQVPAVWFKHARFDHSAHRAVTCMACHEGAYSNHPDAEKASAVLVPNIDNCVECHAPRHQDAGEMVGGARHNCVECHNYHGRGEGDEWLRGRGSSQRGAKQPRSIHDFLNLSTGPP